VAKMPGKGCPGAMKLRTIVSAKACGVTVKRTVYESSMLKANALNHEHVNSRRARLNALTASPARPEPKESTAPWLQEDGASARVFVFDEQQNFVLSSNIGINCFP